MPALTLLSSLPTISVDRSGRSRNQDGLGNATSKGEFGSIGEAARADLESGEMGRVLDGEFVAVLHRFVLQNECAEIGEVGGAEVPEAGERALTDS